MLRSPSMSPCYCGALTARCEEAGCSERLLIVGGGSTAASGGAARQPGGQQFQVRPLRLPDRPQRCG